MNKYFINSNNQKSYTLEELKQQPLTRETLVWYNGLDNWVELKDAPELGELIADIPPTLVPKLTAGIYTKSGVKNRWVLIWLVLLSILVLAGGTAIYLKITSPQPGSTPQNGQQTGGDKRAKKTIDQY